MILFHHSVSCMKNEKNKQYQIDTQVCLFQLCNSIVYRFVFIEFHFFDKSDNADVTQVCFDVCVTRKSKVRPNVVEAFCALFGFVRADEGWCCVFPQPDDVALSGRPVLPRPA